MIAADDSGNKRSAPSTNLAGVHLFPERSTSLNMAEKNVIR